jgi:HNH endonuclease
VTEPLALGEKLLALLDQSARSSTYKPAVLLALVDRAQEHVEDERIPVRSLAERVIELYWPQTLAYPATGSVLLQNQAGGQASIVRQIMDFRASTSVNSRTLPESARISAPWAKLLDGVELTLAEWPIPRLQRPFADFLYRFDWSWEEAGGWSARTYRASSRTVRLHPGVAQALTSLGPLLRPFITRWWTDKAARLNPDVEAARSLVEFEEFLFGRDRVALERVASDLLALQTGNRCFYCHAPIRTGLQVDHFIPWSYCGDDGVDNLVAACAHCNNEKRAALPGPNHLVDLLERNRSHDAELRAISEKRRWPRDARRSQKIVMVAYARSPDERPVWTRTSSGGAFDSLSRHRPRVTKLIL